MARDRFNNYSQVQMLFFGIFLELFTTRIIVKFKTILPLINTNYNYALINHAKLYNIHVHSILKVKLKLYPLGDQKFFFFFFFCNICFPL